MLKGPHERLRHITEKRLTDLFREHPVECRSPAHILACGHWLPKAAACLPFISHIRRAPQEGCLSASMSDLGQSVCKTAAQTQVCLFSAMDGGDILCKILSQLYLCELSRISIRLFFEGLRK